jgi:AcrR family transcriptional regulator
MKSNNKKEVKLDRRIQKTRKLLVDSLLDLILEKGYDDVTIQDIIDRANVGRSTFYAHFENKEQLLIGNDKFKELLSQSLEKSSNAEIDLLNIYQHVEEHHKLAKVFFGKKSGDIIKDHFHNMFAHIIKDYFKKRINREKLEKQMEPLIIEASASAMCSLLFNWVSNDMPFTAQEMATKGREILNSIFRKYL